MPSLYAMSHMAFNNEASTCLHSFSSIDLQVVYDWVGQETAQEYFTLYQFGSGFFPMQSYTTTISSNQKNCAW